MCKLSRPNLSVISLALFLAPSAFCQAGDPGIDFFEKKIRPVLVKHCYECHSMQGEAEGRLLVDTRQGLSIGGESGPAIVAGKPEESLILSAVRYESFKMPPGERLPAHVVKDLETWIKMGAPDPREDQQGVAKAMKEKAEQAANAPIVSDHWSFQPIKSYQFAKGSLQSADIDYRLESVRQEHGLQAVKQADPLTQLRRVSFVLTGLPPSVELIEEFSANQSPGAFEDVVDRLLDSPAFGERWGQHWLDVARFAESCGKELDVTYPLAWKYRNYVIDSFNNDKPYNEFVIEQLAGDLLPWKEIADRNENLIATGFLAVGTKPTDLRVEEEYLMELVDDQIDVTGRAFLGLTISCARCHDHKFDPIPTADYYSMAGIFRSTRTLDSLGCNGKVPERADPDRLGLLEGSGSSAQEMLDHIYALNEAVQQRKRDVKTQQRLVSELNGKLLKAKKENGTEQVASLTEQIAAAKMEIRRIGDISREARRAPPPPLPPMYMGVEDRVPDEIKHHPILRGGDLENKGDVVDRGVLSVNGFNSQTKIPPSHSGRLELAEWIAHPENPLTSRVIVNRVWQHVFGRGLVQSVDNFGVTGGTPSHPELLDALARDFTEHGWSLKRLIKLLIMTDAFRLSSDQQDDNFEIDPENIFVWRVSPRRLDAEAIRDSMLMLSGELNPGRPESWVIGKLGLAKVSQTSAKDLTPKPGTKSIYLPVIRTKSLSPIMDLFDRANSSLVMGERQVTTTASQALFLMNSPRIYEQSKISAERLLSDDRLADASSRISMLYLQLFARLPTPQEQTIITDYIGSHAMSLPKEKRESQEIVAWAAVIQGLISSAEFRYLN
ncbi:Planctomycete cytochrome C [Calycomorphotria hydatis]|uniref:Planctomycete cytochrome C n=2 Tax=Calycomorphotria hydatis TaxID=2528027 RepID=A0A517TEJ1_9PLAN|nr:Planctomycete cytochrome C [Calycomorphotria hydatis]